jgi:peptide deformylase
MNIDNPTERILQAFDPSLKRVAKSVKYIGADELQALKRMRRFFDASVGIGLAATQLGIDKRIIIIDVPRLDAYEETSTVKIDGQFIMINPIITSRSRKACWNEGCLSVPGIEEKVERDLDISVTYTDEKEEQHELNATGLLSACIQHEIDHLDGMLFIDRLHPIRRDIVIRKLKKAKKNGKFHARPAKGMML